MTRLCLALLGPLARTLRERAEDVIGRPILRG